MQANSAGKEMEPELDIMREFRELTKIRQERIIDWCRKCASLHREEDKDRFKTRQWVAWPSILSKEIFRNVHEDHFGLALELSRGVKFSGFRYKVHSQTKCVTLL